MTNENKTDVKRELTAQEPRAITKMKQRQTPSQDIFKLVKDQSSGRNVAVEPAFAQELLPRDAHDDFQARVCAATGASDDQVGLALLTKLTDAVTPSSETFEKTVDRLNTLAKTMTAMEPQDEFEGQLVAQLVTLQEQAITWLGRAMRTDNVNFSGVYLNGASKLLARHHEALGVLMKYRRGGEQRVHVEHVHVHGGGQAIVGNVSAGGGFRQKTEEGPHATV